jgi:hypothetical protein
MTLERAPTCPISPRPPPFFLASARRQEAGVRQKLREAGGCALSASDGERLRSEFHDLSLQPLLQVWSIVPLTGAYFIVDADADASELGVEMQWMSAGEILDEAKNATPGIQARACGLLPIGECASGSGDPYFVDARDASLPVVRVPHAAIDGQGRLREDRVELVASSLEKFFTVMRIERY